MQRVLLQPAFILHKRLYRDTSLLLEVFSEEHGLVHLIARGVRGGKSKMGRFLQPFSPLLLSWQGRTELMTLTQAEPDGIPCCFTGEALPCAFYVNEVLLRVIHRGDPCPTLYGIYKSTLQYLTQSVSISCVLRLFEKQVLIERGYALSLERDLQGALIQPEKKYEFIPALGFKCLPNNRVLQSHTIFSGECVIALQAEQFHNKTVLHEAKYLLRLALAPLLGNKPLKSRDFFKYEISSQ